MSVKSYSTVHLILPVTPKTIAKINKIREDLAQRFGGGTHSRVALPSSVGYWVTVREGEEVMVVDDLSLTVVDIDIEENADYLAYFETFKREKEDQTHPDYLGEDEIWIIVYNTYRIIV